MIISGRNIVRRCHTVRFPCSAIQLAPSQTHLTVRSSSLRRSVAAASSASCRVCAAASRSVSVLFWSSSSSQVPEMSASRRCCSAASSAARSSSIWCLADGTIRDTSFGAEERNKWCRLRRRWAIDQTICWAATTSGEEGWGTTSVSSAKLTDATY